MLNSKLTSGKSNVIAFILCALTGMFGFHRFYVGKYFSGTIQFFTLGGFMIWTIMDCITILRENFTDDEDKILKWDQNKEGEYAGLAVRFAAHLIDAFIISISNFLVFTVFITPIALALNNSYLNLLVEIQEIINILISIFYYTLLSASQKQATIGKEIVGVIVVDKNFKKLRTTHSLARCLAYFFSYISLGIGFLMIAFTKKHRGLHDIIANTYVIYGQK